MKEDTKALYFKLCKENKVSNSINKGFAIFLLILLIAFGTIVGVFLNDSKNMFYTTEYLETLEEREKIDITKIDTGMDAEIFILIFAIICIIAIVLYIFSYKKIKQDRIYREKSYSAFIKRNYGRNRIYI